MLSVFSVILPIFLIMLVGFIAARRRVVSAEGLSAMGRYVITIALPAVIIQTLLSLELREVFYGPFLAAYMSASLLVMSGGFWIYRRLFHQPRINSAIMMTGATVPNSAFIGYPIILQLLDQPPLSAFAMALMVENLVVLPLCFMVMDYAAQSSDVQLGVRFKSLLFRLIRNPLLIAIVVGMVGNGLGLVLPQVVDNALALLAPSAVAVALFVIGGSLAGLSLRETRYLPVLSVTVGKLIVHPLVAMLMLALWMPGHLELSLALVVITAVPMMSIYTVVGDIYQQRAFCATAQLVTTAASALTIPLMVTLAHMLLG